jgi:VWFA-related protein
MTLRNGIGVCLAALAAAAQEAPPLQPGERLVIRTETRVVLVDAVVRDKKGQLVRDLQAKDFRVWEDGKEQTVTSFYTEQDANSPERAQKHYLAFFFDNITMPVTDQIAARREASKFVSAWASPDRYMAVLNFSGSMQVTQNFTSRPEPLIRAVEALQASPVAVSSASAYLNDAQSMRNGQAGSQTQMGGRGGMGMQMPGSATQLQDADQSGYRQNLLSCLQSLAESLSTVRGRKSIVVFGGAVNPVFRTSETARVAEAANKANVAIYLMNPSGLQPLADATGGRTIRYSGDLAGELSKIATEQEEHYVLGYTPAVAEGSCHSLRVSANRNGVDVWSRRGYCTAKRPDLLAGSSTAKALESRAAGKSTGNMPASIRAPYFYSPGGPAKVNVAMEIDASAIGFEKVKGKQHAEISVAGIAYRTDGDVAGRFSDSVKLDFDSEKEAAAFLKRPYHYEYQFDLAPGQYDLRVALASGSTSFGKAETPLAIDAWDGRRLAISGIAIATESKGAPDVASDLDDALLEDRKPLAARSRQVVPSGNNRCRRDGPCLGYVEIYEPALAAPNPPALALQIRIFDRGDRQVFDSGPLGGASFIRPGRSATPMIFEIPAARLTEGSYRMEVTAISSAGGATAMRTADLSVD